MIPASLAFGALIGPVQSAILYAFAAALLAVGTAPAVMALITPVMGGFPAARTQARYNEGFHTGFAMLLAAPIPWLADDTVAAVIWLALAVGCAHLSAIDMGEERLPDTITFPLGILAVTGFAISAAIPGGRGWPDFNNAMIGGLIVFIAFLAVFIVRPDSFGFGDVKLGALLGIIAGWTLGWMGALIAMSIGLVLQAASSVVLLAFGKVRAVTQLPLGPALIVATWGLMAFKLIVLA